MELRRINGVEMGLEQATEENEKLIWMVAQRFAKKAYSLGMEVGDMFGYAATGFIKAFNNFNPDKFNVKFSTYAVPMMVGEVQRYLRDHGYSVKYSRAIVDLGTKIMKQDLWDKTPEEVAEICEVTVEEAKTGLHYVKNRATTSMNAPIGNNDGSEVTLEDQISNKTSALSDTSMINVRAFMDTLTDRDRRIVEMLLEDKRQQDIADELGITQVQVSRLIKNMKPHFADFFINDVSVAKYKKIKTEPKKHGRKRKKSTNSKSEKPSKVAKGDIEEAKRLLSETDIVSLQISKITGCNPSVVYYWEKRLRAKKKLKNQLMKLK